MFLLYLDASGSAELSDTGTKHYVLLGFSMHERDWSNANADLVSLKAKYGYPGLGFELHVKQFAVSIKEQDKIPDFENLSREDRRAKVLEVRQSLLDAETDATKRDERRKRYRTSDPFIHLTRKERSNLLEEAVTLIGSYDGVRLFADAVSKSHPAVVGGTVKPTEEVFKHVIPRFDTFLEKIGRRGWSRNPDAWSDRGLLILDNDPSTEATFHSLFQRFRKQGTPLGALRHVIDVPFFADSEKVGGLQLADVAAYVIRRYLDTGAKTGSHEERQFRTISRLFDRDPSGRLHGIRHYTPAGVCPCLICAERGHGVTSPKAPSGEGAIVVTPPPDAS